MGDISDRVKRILEVEGLTYNQFAKKIGVAASAVSHFINRRNKPSLDAIAGILTAFPDISPDWLLLGIGEIKRDADGVSDAPIQATQIEIPHGPSAAATRQGSLDTPGDRLQPRAASQCQAAADAPTVRSQGAEIPPATPRVGGHEPTQTASSHASPVGCAADARPFQIVALYPDGTFDCFNPRGGDGGSDRRSAEE